MARPVFKAAPSSRRPPPPSVATAGVRTAGASASDRPRSPSPEPAVSDLWAEKHAPASVAELALHKAKLDEIRRALDPRSSNRVVVVSGPSGSSKSTAVRLVCEEQRQAVLEFVAPEASVGSTGVVASFREFLVGAAMYDRASTAVIVDDMPNIFHDGTRQLFEEALVDWAADPLVQPVLIVVFTEIEVSAHYSEAAVVPRVLGQLVADQQHCCWIRTNAVNATLISRTLKLVLGRERRTCPPAVVKEIAQCGDIRNALTALELYLLAPLSSSANSLVRGFPVQLFHAIGKVIWGTSKEGSLEEALELFSDTLDTFNLTILENYCAAKHSRLGLSAAAVVAECLSEADISTPDLAPLAVAQVIQTSDADERATRRFENLRFTQYMRWKRQEHESRSAAIARLSDSRLHQGPISLAAVVLDEGGYESQLRRPVDMVPDISSDEDDF